MPERKSANAVCTSLLLHLLLVAVLLVPGLSHAVVRDHYFRTLDSHHGLAQSSVTAMLSSRSGFAWIATQSDLHRYDGYAFQSVTRVIGAEPLPSFALTLAEDDSERIYIGTLQDGLFVLDLAQRQLARATTAAGSPHLPAGRIEVLLYQPGTGLWIASPTGVGRLDLQTDEYREVLEFDAGYSSQVDGSLKRSVRAMTLDEDGMLWIGTSHGLYRLDTSSGLSGRISSDPVGALLTDHDGKLWIGTNAGLLRVADSAPEGSLMWPPTPPADITTCCDTIALAQAADGAIWLSVRNGHLWRYDRASGEAEPIVSNPWIDGMLSETGVQRIMIDRSNLLWLGGYARGIATTPADGTPFRAVFDMDPTRDPVSGNFIRVITESRAGDLWLGTHAGLRRYDPVHDQFDAFDSVFAALPEHESNGSVPIPLGIETDGGNQLWLATNIGLYHFDPAARKAEKILLQVDADDEKLTAIARVRDGTLWLGYSDHGLFSYNPLTGKSTAMPPRPDVVGAHHQVRVTTIQEDSRGRIWIGGMMGLSRFDPATGQFQNFEHDPADTESLSGNIVRTIHETRDGAIWVGSHGGLDQVIEPTSGKVHFRRWSIGGEGSGPVVYGVAEDSAGRLWLSGNHGIVQLDRLENRQVHFGPEAGLQDLEFNGGAVATLRDGRLAFGGIRGLNLFDPALVRPRPFEARVALSSIRKGTHAPVGQAGAIIPITMPQQDRLLNIAFTALDFTAPETHRFSYKLEGFDPDFSPPSPRPWATYTNLPPGRYLFRVRASNHTGTWSSQELRVPVKILPPWWRTAWAYAAYALLLMILIGLLWRSHRKRTRQRANLIAQIREREDRLKLSLWGAGDWFWDWDLRGSQISRIGADHVLPHAESELINTEDWRQKGIHPEDLPRVQELMHKHLAGESDAYESEHRIRDSHGDWTWVRARGKVVDRDADFNPLRVSGTARDITSNRQADRDRRIASEVLRSMNEAVAVIDLNFRFVSVNPAFSRITGYEEKDVVGMPVSLLDSTQHPPEFYHQAHEALRTKGHTRGEVWQRRANGDEFLSWIEQSEVCDESGTRTHYVAVVNDITDKKRIEQELRYLANYDTLTGLPNRTLLSERLARTVVRARRHGTRGAVLFLDLDHFKLINDSLGHAAGDRILRSAAVRLQSVASSSDTVARLGGDEFTIIMEDVTDVSSATAMAEAVIAAFGEPILNDGGGDVIISPSIGISLFPEHATAPTDLLKFADAAMYRAKARGRNTFQFYDESMDAEVQRRASMTAALRRALERGEFHLVFQPRQSLFDGRINGVEVLLRWTNEEFGVVPPTAFIPLAEETGLILPIGKWVLENACATLSEWIKQGVDQVGISVNVSVLQLLRDNLPASVTHALEASGLPAARLELELTESMVMANAEQAITVLGELKRLGVSIAIDDFGTGYSSLIYLKRLPIDTLKIDKEFVGDLTHDPDDEAIVTTIISMAHSLGLTVVAEGVETPDQLRYLREQGCDEIQGYLLAHPMRADDCLKFLRDHAQQHHSLPVS